MKVTFELNLPDDQHEYEVINQASKVQSFLWDWSQQLRSWDKYGHTFTSADDAVDKIREEFYRLINEHEINLDL